ncbi:hypothetical protein NPIL_650371 [Nephila pilipes]|uniref:Uncharacterized protein n=1 Tax=Nephila pilipes TaxID=299642 RepID=A0A8X6UJD0_NEPPI|nr:hypothetical protein NPIL_650371 [Nephila pilipes]
MFGVGRFSVSRTNQLNRASGLTYSQSCVLVLRTLWKDDWTLELQNSLFIGALSSHRLCSCEGNFCSSHIVCKTFSARVYSRRKERKNNIGETDRNIDIGKVKLGGKYETILFLLESLLQILTSILAGILDGYLNDVLISTDYAPFQPKS